MTDREQARAGEPLRGDRVVVRAATAGDAGMLVRWHADPEVARYWDDEIFSNEEMLERLARPDVHAYIVEHDGEPVGYLQAWFGGRDEVSGLDMFLVPPARGRGLGPDAGRTVARHLVDRGGRRRVTVDPYVWNERAVAAWRAAGFRPVEEREPDEDHRHRWLLMEFEP